MELSRVLLGKLGISATKPTLGKILSKSRSTALKLEVTEELPCPCVELDNESEWER